MTDKTETCATPEVGMGCSFSCWTDVYPGTIVEVRKNAREIVVQQDDARRVDNNGMSESQSYLYVPNPKGKQLVFSLRKDGRWIEKGRSKDRGYRCSIGTRRKYHDYSF